MNTEQPNRRQFIHKSCWFTAAAAAAGLSLEEKALIAQQQNEVINNTPAGSASDEKVPMGRIGQANIGRLICGGNLLGGYAHDRDLIYVSSILKHYFTDEKIFETWQLCEQHGINTIIINNRNPKGGGNSKDDRALELFNRYRKERGGKIQLLAQCNPTEHDLFTNLKKAVDNGAIGAFLQGGIGDGWSGQKIDLIEKCIEFIKKNGLIAGVAGHSFAMVENGEAAGLENDFYMKTINNTDYWSARHPEKNDNIWTGSKNEIAECIEFMKTVKKAWIGYKVLAAGAIHPEKGFPFAFDNGADFVAVGMFDFQIQANSQLCRQAVTAAQKRPRPWWG